MTGRLPRIQVDPEEEFTGAEIRRLTARVTAARTGAGPGELFTDVAYAVTSALITAGLIAGIANALRLGLAPASGTGAPDARWVQAVAIAAVMVTALGLAIRVGPLGISRAGVTWWLPMPVDRAGLLIPSWWRAVLIWPTVCGGLAAFASVVAGVSAADVASGAVWGAVGGLIAVAVAGLVQPSPRGASAVAHAADVLIAAVPAAGLAVVVAGTPTPARGGWVVCVLGALVAAVALVRWRPRFSRLPAAVLAARAGTADRALGAAMSLDTRELGRSLGDARTAGRRRSHTFGAVRGPASAIVAADTVLLARTPAALAQLVGLVCAMLLALQIPALGSGAALFIVMVVVGFRAGQLGAAGARIAEMVPGLDGLVPLAAHWTRGARCLTPCVVGALTLLVGTLPLAWRWGPGWVGVALLAGAILGLAAVRSAYRKPPDWSGPLMATPGGALPTGAMAAVSRGPDVALLGSVPLGVAVVTSHVSAGILLAQVMVGAIVVAVVTRVPARP